MDSKRAKSLDYASLSINETAQRLLVSLDSGLIKTEAALRLKQYGKNQIASDSLSLGQIFIRQLNSPFLYLLIFASFLSYFFGEHIDTLLIFIFILISVSFGFYQEYKSDRSLKVLRKYTQSRDLVKRNGYFSNVDSRDIVPGDVIALMPGDIAPADIRLVEAQRLLVDESVLTGESMFVAKDEKIIEKDITNLYEAKNIVFSGSVIKAGSGVGIVVATGKQSIVGELAKLSKTIQKESDFTKGIGALSNFVLKIVVFTIISLFIVNLLLKKGEANFVDLFVFSIALTVTVIPAGLPVVSIFSLSRGALRMAKKKVVVKRLSAIEDLGGINVLCTDKTGTLTENILKVKDSLVINEKADFDIFVGLTNGAEGKGVSDPFDIALMDYVNEKGIGTKLSHWQIIKEIPFDPDRKINSVFIKSGSNFFLISRGAPEEILKRCKNLEVKKQGILWTKEQGRLGRRVLAFASKATKEEGYDEENLNLLGFISFEDPIKKTTFGAVKKAKQLGVEVKILTGDAPEVAGAVAYNIGLVKDPGMVITGERFLGLSQAEQHKAVDYFSVFARISPEQKHNIITLLQEHHFVGFLGEGINDTPALKAAKVSLVVKSASDVAREAADIVILQKNLNVIIDGIEEGRIIFANTLKYIKATLAANFGNFYAVAITSLFIDFLPMLPVQILLVNLLTDFPMIAIATDNVDSAELKFPQAYKLKSIALVAILLGIVSTIFDFIYFALYFKVSPAVLQTNWFVASVVSELIFLFSVRSRKFAFTSKGPSPVLAILTLLAFITTILLPFTNFGQNVFRFTPPSLWHLATILGIALLYFVSTEAVKLFYYRSRLGRE